MADALSKRSPTREEIDNARAQPRPRLQLCPSVDASHGLELTASSSRPDVALTGHSDRQPPSSFNIPQDVHVWFQLVDATGKEFPNVDLDSVTLRSLATVVEFRDAVKAKYNYPNYLKDIPSSALSVYAFNEQIPLSAYINVTVIGSLAHRPLLVKVSTPSSNSNVEPATVSKRPVCFQLVDPHGNLRESTYAVNVFRDDCVVHQFQKAVKAELHVELKEIEARRLIVYANQAAFQHRNDSEITKNGLDLFFPLDQLGLDRNQPLYVMLPIPTYDISVNKEYCAKYLERSVALIDNSVYKAYVEWLYQQALDTVKVEGIPPFLFVGLPSGYGKTQMAMSLNTAYEGKVFYLVDTIPEYATQRVYEAFSACSRVFDECVQKDLNNLGLYVSPRAIADKDLYGFGFIYALLGNGYAADAIIEKKSMKKVRSLWVEKNPPVFWLDECPSMEGADDTKKRLHSLKRSYFRALRFPIILSGTECKVANLVPLAAISRTDMSKHWCTVITRLPKFVDITITHQTGIHREYQELLDNSSPWFSELALSQLSRWRIDTSDSLTAKALELVVQSVYDYVSKDKGIFENVDGKRGQIYLLMNSAFLHEDVRNIQEPSTQKLLHSPYMDRHFALLSSPTPLKLDVSTGTNRSMLVLGGSHDEWKPETFFPAVKDNILLSVSLTGFAKHSAFGKENTSLLDFWKSVASDTNSRKNVKVDNYVQSSNSGKLLEALTTAALIVSSHIGNSEETSLQIGHSEGTTLHIRSDMTTSQVGSEGTYSQIGPEITTSIFGVFEGTKVDAFLSELVFHLTDTRVPIGRFKSVAKILNSLTIPFWLPPNQDVPRCLENLAFGKIYRTKDDEKIDVKADAYYVNSIRSEHVTAECKDWSRKLTSEEISKIIKRCPETSRLHIVVTNYLQGKYYTTKGPDLNDREREHLCQFRYFRLNKGELMQFKHIETALEINDNSNCDRVMIFMELIETPETNSEITLTQTK